MSTSEEKALLGAAPDEPASQSRDAPQPDATERSGGDGPVAQESLSPAVRRLVRQFDLDITGIHGTGPSGRIRVGDVMGLLGGRTDSGNRDAPARPAAHDEDADVDTDGAPLEREATAPAAGSANTPTTTVFDCDVGRVLAHRKKLRLGDVEILTTSYFLTALAAALDATPEITAGHAPCFGVSLITAEGELYAALLDTAAIAWDRDLGERVQSVDSALRANLGADVSAANLLVHHYGESGSLLATPTPIGDGHEASIGIGCVRREIGFRAVNGVETPRATLRCYLSLSFCSDRVPLHHANRALAEAVRILESWPD